MGWFSGSKDMSAGGKRKILTGVLEKVRAGSNEDARMLIANAIGGRTGPDDKTVTAMMQDIVSYGLPSTERAKSTDLSGWWTQASVTDRAKVIADTIECLK